MTALERALAALDDGVQRSTEPAMTVGDGCWRCGRTPAEGSDLCGGCRAYLLETSDVDPRLGPPPGPQDRPPRRRRPAGSPAVRISAEAAAVLDALQGIHWPSAEGAAGRPGPPRRHRPPPAGDVGG